MNGSELVVDIACRTGEGPLWHPEEACLYWVDIPNGALLRYRPREGTAAAAERVMVGPVLGAATLQRDGGLALFGLHGAVLVWSECGIRPVVDELRWVRGTRFNDAIADSSGRVLSGTMPTAGRPSSLVCIEPDGSAHRVLRGLGQSNGMALGADERTLFHVDTHERVLCAYDYDVDTGQPIFARTLRSFDAREGVPDGMAADAEGMLWIAMWGGGCVVRIDPSTGREIDRVLVPTPLTSSVAFGGSDLRDLYVTTAGGDDRARTVSSQARCS